MTGRTVLRSARLADARSIGAILQAFIKGTPWMPDVHTAEEVTGFVSRLIAREWVTVIEARGRVVGFLAREACEVHALYLAPAQQGRGLGKIMLDQAKQEADELMLWTFQANTGAQRFYEREGFAEIERTNGDRNPERLPDIRYRWERNRA